MRKTRVEIEFGKGNLKFDYGDNGDLVVELRMTKKLFIVTSYIRKGMYYEKVDEHHFKYLRPALKKFDEVYEQF